MAKLIKILTPALSTAADRSTVCNEIGLQPHTNNWVGVRNTSLFLRLNARTIPESNTCHVVHSTSSIQNNSLFLRLHARTTYESNLEQLLVFKAPRVGDPRVEHHQRVDGP